MWLIKIILLLVGLFALMYALYEYGEAADKERKSR